MTDRVASATTVDPAADPLRLEQCPACGYSLLGLLPEGVCPECGRAYDQSVIVLHGWARGGRADITTARPWVAALIAALYLLLLLRYVGRAGEGGPLAYVCPAIVLLFLALGFWKRWTNDLPGLVQVRVGPEGCLQADDPRGADAAKLTPWAEVGRVVVEPRRRGRARVQVFLKSRPASSVVDAELLAEPARAEALRRRIEEWKNRSDNTAAGDAGAAAPCPPAAGV